MKKLRNLILIMIFTFIGIINISAEEKYSIKLDIKTGTIESSLSMSLEGIDMEDAIDNKIYYFIKFANEGDEKPVLSKNPLFDNKVDFSATEYNIINIYYDSDTNKYTNEILVLEDWFLLKGYEKAYVIKCEDLFTCETSNQIDIKKPELPELSQRYQIFLYTNVDNEAEKNTISVLNSFPYYGTAGSHELNVKIGLINDQDLLNKLNNKEQGSLEILKKYAKNADGKVFTKKDIAFYNININNFEIVDGKSYYIYTYYTNKDGIYRDLDDIAIAVGKNSTLINDVEWNKTNKKTNLWDTYVDRYTKFMNLYDINVGTNFEIKHTNNALKLTYKYLDSLNYIDFKYADNILEFLPIEEPKFAYIDFYPILSNVSALAELYNYDIDLLKLWFDQDIEFDLEKDGIEFSTEPIVEKIEGVEVEYDKITAFKLDIRGLKTFEEWVESGADISKLKLSPKEEDGDGFLDFDKENQDLIETPKEDNKSNEITKNPSTGINLGYGILGFILFISIVGYIIIKKQSKFPKYN